ncbi:MAG TPA: hypothetical protein VHO07_18270 [Streptosporangiaceae bacterium]|nr:hypothetical protein [Streptosporangiaceae bacterium]
MDFFADALGVLGFFAGVPGTPIGVGGKSRADPAPSAAAAGPGAAAGRLGARDRVVRRFSGSSAGLMA